jgi:hypothetical protein
MPPRALAFRNLAFFASLAVLAFGVWFQVSLAQHWTRPASLPYGLNNPVLAIQMAKPPYPAAILAPPGNNDEMTRQQYIDFGYIPSYALLFICIALLQRRSNRRWMAALAPFCILLILIAAAFDIAENFAILGVTAHHDSAAWALIRTRSLVKWTCAFLVILLESPFYLTQPRILARILGAASLLAGAIGLAGSLSGSERAIGIATLPLLLAMLLMPVFLWPSARGRS